MMASEGWSAGEVGLSVAGEFIGSSAFDDHAPKGTK